MDNLKAHGQQNKKKTLKVVATAEISGTSVMGDKYHTYQLAEPEEDTCANSENVMRFESEILHLMLKTTIHRVKFLS